MMDAKSQVLPLGYVSRSRPSRAVGARTAGGRAWFAAALSLRMPLRFMRGGYGRVTLTVLALASGVALVSAIDLVNRAVVRAFVEVVDTMAGRAALQVTPGDGALLPEDIAEIVASVPGVELAVPAVSATAFVADGSGESITIQGVDLANENAVRIYDAYDDAGGELDDPLVFLNKADSVALTRSFARRHDLGVDDTLSLVTPNGRREFTVRALLEADGVARVYGGNLAVMDLYAAERAFTQPEFVNRVDVVVDRDGDVSAVADAIGAVLSPGLRVEAPSQRKADLHKTMRSLQVIVQGVASLGLVAAFLIAFSRLTTVFERRAWQLGVLRAVGVRTAAVGRELIKEGLLLGALGVLTGIPLGIALARLLLPVIATMTAVTYKLVAPEAALRLSPASLVLAAVMGIAAALLAAAVPAWHAARRNVATAIGGRGIERPATRGAAARFVGPVSLVAAAACVYLQVATGSATWGLAATMLLAVAAALGARPLLDLMARPLGALLGRIGGPSGRLAADSLLHNPRRAALMIGTLGVGLGAVVWLAVLSRSFEQSLITSLESAMRADLVVTSANLAAGFLEAPVDEKLAGELQRIDGVQAVAAERVADWHYAGGPIAIDAYDPSYFSEGVFGRLALLGSHAADVWQVVARGDGVVISNNLALHLGLNVGDPMNLETPSGPLELRVAGISVVFISPRGTVVMSRDAYVRSWHDKMVNHLFVQTRPGASGAAVRTAITRELGAAYGLRVLSSAELIDFFAGQVRRAFSALQVLAGLVLLVVLIGVGDTLAAGVAERVREIGSVRAIGVRPGAVARMILLEAVALGGLGLLLALAAGLALGFLWVDYTFPLFVGWTLEHHVPLGQIGLAGVLAIVVCVLGGLAPALRAAKLRPADALRCE